MLCNFKHKVVMKKVSHLHFTFWFSVLTALTFEIHAV